jgi:FkbM family methyltransferase
MMDPEWGARYGAVDRCRMVLEGRELVFCTEDAYTKAWFFPDYDDGRLHEPQVTRLLITLLAESRLFVDVGANIGYFSCIAAKFLPEGLVHAFEMNESFLPRVRRNLEVNDCHNILLHPLAVSDAAGEVWYEPGTTIEGIYPDAAGRAVAAPSRLSRVAAVSLDEFFVEGFTTPAVVKIDVEGAEIKVLKGMRRLLATAEDVKLLVEIHPRHLRRFGSSVKEVLQILFGHGFAVAEIPGLREDRGALRLRELRPGSMPRRNTMLYARRPEKSAR